MLLLYPPLDASSNEYKYDTDLIALFLKECREQQPTLVLVHDALERHMPEHHLLKLIKRYMGIWVECAAMAWNMAPGHPDALINMPHLGNDWLGDAEKIVTYTMLMTCSHTNGIEPNVKILESLAAASDEGPGFCGKLAEAISSMPLEFFRAKTLSLEDREKGRAKLQGTVSEKVYHGVCVQGPELWIKWG